MLTYMLPIILRSKPTGNLGKGRNIYQNSQQYLEYKRQGILALRPQLQYSKFSVYGIYIVGFLGDRKSRSQDLGQLSGAIYDLLVSAKIIEDDRLTNFNCNYSQYFYKSDFESEYNDTQGAVIYLAEKSKEWALLLSNWDKKEIAHINAEKLYNYSFTADSVMNSI